MKDHIIETCCTMYHTPSGVIEVPNPSVKITEKSHLAPLWLVFPDHIINTKHIIDIRRIDNNNIEFVTIKGHFTVHVTDIDITWRALQKAFAEGVSDAE
ncbi:MAG: hypothetical protein PHS54_00670 [Clostridia bacterium]|nr:hypothetical protein [Clostridia bacterium]